MRILCVEDEKIQLQGLLGIVNQLPETKMAAGYRSAGEAIEAARKTNYDVAILDIELPDMNGLELAATLKEINPELDIIFTTAYSHYAIDAFKVKASGYVLKPFEAEDISRELDYIRNKTAATIDKRPFAHTFGLFDLMLDGVPIKFHRSKSKEVLAYLIDREGVGVHRAELAAIIWEDIEFDRPHQKQLDVFIRDLRKDLRMHDIENILDINKTIRVCPENFDCDLYRFMAGDSMAINSFRGEYMTQYSWAEFRTGSLVNK